MPPMTTSGCWTSLGFGGPLARAVEFLSNPQGNEFATGEPDNYTHAYSGREGENPSGQVWVK